MRRTLTILFVFAAKTLSQTCDYENSVVLSNRYYNGHKYEEGEFFVDNTTGFERGCVCVKEVCARKCCPFGQAYSLGAKECLNVSDGFNPPVWDGSEVLPGFNVSKEFHFLFNKMNCSSELDEARIPIGSTAPFNLSKNGELLVQIENEKVQRYGPDKYCIDNFVIGPPGESSPVELNALICFTQTPQNNHYEVSCICMMISCFFILLTVAVYSWVPELRNLHGMVLMAYLLSLFVGFAFLSTMQAFLLWGRITIETCITFTFIIYFSLLAGFFWLNVLCYDIWWTFSGKRSMSSGPASKKNRFFSYSLYAFGVPSLLTILLIILEFAVPPSASPYLPKIGEQGCFIYGRSKFIYLYTPMIVLCIANLIFFTLTALKISHIKKQTSMLNKKDEQRFSLYIKLFVVMGINWILEVVSSFYPDTQLFWKFMDAYNVLVGFIIFVIFVCKRKTLKRIKERIKDCSWSDSNDEEMKDIVINITNKNISRWQNNKGARGSIDTIRTTLGTDLDNKSIKSVTSNRMTR